MRTPVIQNEVGLTRCRHFFLLSDSGRPGEPGEVGRNPDRHAAELPPGSPGGRLQPEAAGRKDHRRALLRQSGQKSPLRNLQAGEIQTLDQGLGVLPLNSSSGDRNIHCTLRRIPSVVVF